MTRAPAEAVRGLWRTLSARDYDGIADWVTDDCIYLDVPVGPTHAARGPVDIAKRRRVGWGGLAAYENHDGLIVCDDAGNAMYEHAETWTFGSGEVFTLDFVSVHQVRDGRICLWKDYWDYGAIMNNAPASWVESLANADTSWVYDATGQV